MFSILLAGLLCLFATSAFSHDVPNEIVLNGFIKPDGDRLHFLVRVPLIMLANQNLPKRGPGYIALDRLSEASDRAVRAIVKDLRLYEGGRLLEPERWRVRIAQPSERTFDTYQSALGHIEGPPLSPGTNVFWNQGYFDAHLEYPIRAERSDFSLDFLAAPGLSGRLRLVVRYIPPDDSSLAYTVHAGFGTLVLNPDWYHSAYLFVRLGFNHILGGNDHILFLLLLIIPFGARNFWKLAGVVTAFTIAHSVTLIASALGVVPTGEWFPPVVEVLIAASILYMAVENVVTQFRDGSDDAVLKWRWLVTAGFGLVHGFGFSFALKEDLQFAGSHLLLSLLSFNVGVEFGQLVVLTVILGMTSVAFSHARVRRLGIVLTSILVGHTAWHWAVERSEKLKYVEWPSVNTSVVIGVVVLALLCAGGWRATRQLGRRSETRGASLNRSS